MPYGGSRANTDWRRQRAMRSSHVADQFVDVIKTSPHSLIDPHWECTNTSICLYIWVCVKACVKRLQAINKGRAFHSRHFRRRVVPPASWAGHPLLPPPVLLAPAPPARPAPSDEALSAEVLEGLPVVNVALRVLELLVDLSVEAALGLVLGREAA